MRAAVDVQQFRGRCYDNSVLLLLADCIEAIRGPYLKRWKQSWLRGCEWRNNEITQSSEALKLLCHAMLV
jgi:hypothetical protein